MRRPLLYRETSDSRSGGIQSVTRPGQALRNPQVLAESDRVVVTEMNPGGGLLRAHPLQHSTRDPPGGVHRRIERRTELLGVQEGLEVLDHTDSSTQRDLARLGQQEAHSSRPAG